MPSETIPSNSRVSEPVPVLDLYAEWREPVTTGRVARAAIGSIAAHVILITFFWSLPEVIPDRRATVIEPDLRNAVHLEAPRFFEPTQKAPNKGKVSRELDVRSVEPAPRPQAPRFRAPQPAPGPVAEAKPSAATAPPQIEQPRIEQPKIEVAASAPPPVPAVTPNPAPPPPQPPAPAKPKLAFESVGAGQTYSAPNPNSTIPDPRSKYLGGNAAGAGGTLVGDAGASKANVPGINEAPSIGRPGSNLQLLSDAKGVDFRPYLNQILTTVRRNWLSILPDTARLGQRGRVLIQFAIDRNGSVPKVVIAEGAGADTLDRAAVAAISASYPFPPLPADYKGDQIRLQFAFSYNMPR
jgi:TonB family protein